MTTQDDRALPTLVAHRGNAAEFPENTLESLESAVALGLRHVEFDVQLTADRVPVVFHDSDLRRVAGRPECVHDLAWTELAQVPIGENARFGDRYREVRAPALAEVMDALGSWPGVTAFVEVKRASLRRFGHAGTLPRIASDVRPALEQCVWISFDLPSVLWLRENTGGRIGWVIERYDAETERQARELAPDFLFGDVEHVPAGMVRLWDGPWRWAMYEVRDVETARRCGRLGAGLVETMTVRDMIDGYARAARA
jgi:glycerophosphoryl diester phosphodiesterase